MAPAKKPTPRKAAVKKSSSSSSARGSKRTPISKAKVRPNGSILNYFKKVSDESLFIGDGADQEMVDDGDDDDDDNDHKEGGSSRHSVSGDEAENGDGGPPLAKKQKLSAAAATATAEERGGTEVGPRQQAATAVPARKKKATANPFLDESDDDEDENDETGGGGEVASAAKNPMVRTKHAAVDVVDVGDPALSMTPHSGFPKLTTSSANLFRDGLPLLRHETSGACACAGDDDGGNDFDDTSGNDKDDDGKSDGGGGNGTRARGDVVAGGAGNEESLPFDEFNDLDDDAAFELLGGVINGGDGDGQWGEEFREMRYMQEQARLEAEEAGVVAVANVEEGGDGDCERGDVIEECCPICSGSLTGATESQATAHVNACLDGTPVPLPDPPDGASAANKAEERVDSAEVGKRFARAAVPRPGQTNPISLAGGAGEAGVSGLVKSAFTRLMSSHAEDTAWATAAAAENASRGMPAYKRTCPFYKIMPGFNICVDAFRYGAVAGCNAYFLSHFHSDHYVGLTANWTHGPIYCSNVTGSLVKSQLKTAAKYVVELDFEKKVPVPGTQGVSVTMIPANHCPGSSLFLFEKPVGGRRVQRILHCGDFRACPAHISHPELRPEVIDAVSGKTNQQKIDVCYLDTTYLNPRYSFPPQDDVVRACAELCVSLDKGLAEDDDRAWNALLRRREGGAPTKIDSVAGFFKPGIPEQSPQPLKRPSTSDPKPDTTPNAFTTLQRADAPNKRRLLVICGTYSIGKERICKAIALALGTKIFASPAKIRICQQLDDPELVALMTSDPREAQVHMQMLMEIRAETLAEYLEIHNRYFSRIVGFRPSGWNYRPAAGAGGAGGGGVNLPPTSLPSAQLLHGSGWRTRFRVRDLVPQRGSSREAMCFGVPYSEHSSFRELALFLMALRVEKVVPTVNVGSEQSRKRMKGWTDRWLAERRKGGLVKVLQEEEEEEEGGVDDVEKGKGNEKGKEKGKGDKVKKGGVVLWDGKSGKGGHVYW